MQNLKRIIKFLIKTHAILSSSTLLCAQQNELFAPLDSDTQELLQLCMNDSFTLEKNQKAIALIHNGASLDIPLQNPKSPYNGKTATEIIAFRLTLEKVPVVKQLLLLFKSAIEQAHDEVEQKKATVKKALPQLLEVFMPRALGTLVIKYY